MPTGLLPVWRRNCEDPRVRNIPDAASRPADGIPCANRGIPKEEYQPGFYRYGERRTKVRPTGLLPVWPRAAGILGARSRRTPLLNPLTGPQRKLGSPNDIPAGLLPTWSRDCSRKVRLKGVLRPGVTDHCFFSTSQVGPRVGDT
jgi:hypothetical protein